MESFNQEQSAYLNPLLMFSVPSVLTSLLYESKPVPAWRLSCKYVSLCVCPCICLSLCECCVCLSHRGLHSVFIAQCRNHHMGKEWDTWQKSLTEFYRGLSLWLQLISTDPDNINDKHYFFATDIHTCMLSTFMVDFRKGL